MIPAQHTRFHAWFISRYTRRGLKKYFHSVHIHGKSEEQGKAILVVGNHFSWWDGFFIYYLNNLLFNRKFHVMMLEEQLRKNKILNKVGAFSVQKNSRSLLESLHYARSVLAEGSQNLLLYYPQGEIESLYTEEFRFEKGLERVVKGLEADVTIYMVAVLVDYFSNKKPELHISLQEFPSPETFQISELQDAYNSFIREAKSKQYPSP